MSISIAAPSKTVFLQAVTANILASTKRLTCDDFVADFRKAAERHTALAEDELASSFHLLARVSSLHLKPDDPDCPLLPFLITPTGRSPSVEDFTDEEIRLFAQAAPFTADHDLKARLSDVAWIRLRDHKAAQLAVESYIGSAKLIATDSISIGAIERLERAAQISAMLGSDTLKSLVRTALLDFICTDATIRPIVAECMDLMLKAFRSDSEALSLVAERRASELSPDNSFIWQRRFWELAAQFHLRSKNEEATHRALREVAVTFEREADERLSNPVAPSLLVAATFLEHAIQAYRRIPDSDADRERLHLRLVECQKKAVSELKSTNCGSVNLSTEAAAAARSVAGKPLTEAIQLLALRHRSPDLSKLRAEAIQSIDQHPLAFLFEATTLSPTGKVVAKHGAAHSSGDDRESLILRQMWTSARLTQQLMVVGFIDPMRRQILLDGHIRLEDLRFLVSYNPLVPIGREAFYAKGLHAGLHGNMVEALHILLPQFENSLRCLLESKGILVSSLSSQGLQKEHDLNGMLYEPRLTEIFPENIVFELRWLLVEQAGANFRNMLAHGMLQYGAFFSDTATYIWWLILKLCILPSMQRDSETSG